MIEMPLIQFVLKKNKNLPSKGRIGEIKESTTDCVIQNKRRFSLILREEKREKSK